MSIDLAYAAAYITAYVAWTSLFRSSIDPWMRRHLGDRFGVEVIWVPAVSFPVKAWTWGLTASRDELDSRLAFLSAAACFAGASLPTALLCVLSRWTTCLSLSLRHALYLASTPLLLFFLVSQMKRQEA
jgi:hypothetical protein